MNKMRNFRSLFCLLVLLIVVPTFLTGCSGAKEIDKMKKILLNSSFQRGKEGCWATQYGYDLTDDVKLQCQEIMMLYKDGTFKEKREFYYDGQIMAVTSCSGKWDISSGSENSFYFDQDYDNDIKVENANFSDEWFAKFDTDIRVFLNGDYSESNDDGDDNASGLGIIDCTTDVFILQSLSDDEIYRYEPHTPYLISFE